MWTEKKRWWVAIAVVSTIMACSWDKPQSPTWNLHVNVPLMDSTYTAQDIAEDNDEVIVLDSGQLGFQFEEELYTTRVGDQLRLNDIHASYEIGLEDFDMPAIETGIDRYLFSQFSQEVFDKNGQISTIAPFTFTGVRGQSTKQNDFRYADINTGKAIVTLVNNTPVPFENVVLRLMEEADGRLVLSVPFSSVPANSMLEDKTEVIGKIIDDDMTWFMDGRSPGSGGKDVFIDQSTTVEVRVSLDEVYVNKMTARFPELTLEHSELIDLDQDVAIRETAFKQGTLTLSVTNNTVLESEIDFAINHFYSAPTGEPLTIDMVLPPNSTATEEIDLTGFTAALDLPSSGIDQNLPVNATGTTVEIKKTAVTMADEQSIAVDMSVDDVLMDYIQGRFDNYAIDLDSTRESLGTPALYNEMDGLLLTDGRLDVRVYNTARTPFQLDGVFRGFDAQGRFEDFRIQERIEAGTGSGEAETVLSPYTSQNSNILDFINLPPSSVAFYGQAKLGDGSTVGRIDSEDYFRASMRFQAAAKMVINEHDIHVDTSKIFIDPEDYEDESQDSNRVPAETTDRLQSVSVNTKIRNHLPIGLRLMMRMATDSTKLHSAPEVVVGPLDVDPGEVNAEGQVTGAPVQDNTLEITSDMIHIFQNKTDIPKPVFIVSDLTLKDSGGNEVQVYASDFVQIEALITLIVELSDD